MTGKKKWIAIAGLFVVTFVLMFFYARQMRQNRMQKDKFCGFTWLPTATAKKTRH